MRLSRTDSPDGEEVVWISPDWFPGHDGQLGYWQHEAGDAAIEAIDLGELEEESGSVAVEALLMSLRLIDLRRH